MPTSSSLVIQQRIYFSCCRRFNDTSVEHFAIRAIEVCFRGIVVPSYDCKEDEFSHFDTLNDCDILVLLPNRYDFDELQLWEAKVFFALKRPVYLFTEGEVIYLVLDMAEIGLHPNSRLHYVE